MINPSLKNSDIGKPISSGSRASLPVDMQFINL